MKHSQKLLTIKPPTGRVSHLPHTLAPQRDTLLLVSLTDAVVTVAVHVVAGMAVMQVDVGGTVRAGAGAELRQIT